MVAVSDRGKTPKLHWAELSYSQILMHRSQQRGLPFPATAMSPFPSKPKGCLHMSTAKQHFWVQKVFNWELHRYLSAIVFSNVTPRETRPAASLTALSHVSLEDRKDRSRVFQCITLEVLIHYAKLRTNYFVPMPSVQDYGTDTSPCAWPEGQHLCMSSAAYICHIPSSCLHAAWARVTGSV